MQLLVVGGHTRNIGKTALVVDLLRAFPEGAWTAVKITQYGHGMCSRKGEACVCAPDEHTFALDEERDPGGRSDTARFLAAGAAHSLWLRTKQGRLAEALPTLREALRRCAAADGNVIIESNTLLQFLSPRLYVVVLDPSKEDFKESARQYLDRADGFVLRQRLPTEVCETKASRASAWEGRVSTRLLGEKPQYYQPLGSPLPETFVSWVRERFGMVERASD